MLRRWQKDCIEIALRHYESHSHFLCLATPGAGKSFFAAELARHMIEYNQIDLVLCFSPSTSIATGLRLTMEMRLGRSFDGRLGSVGASYTYQNMLFFNAKIWSLLKQYRVLVVFDEIHHCSGTKIDNANAWGEKILLNILDKATFTLALTGTPWRSDKLPIVLSRYRKRDGRCHVDYKYGLLDAINDGVCRIPKICLIENDCVSISSTDIKIKRFASLGELFKSDCTSYTKLIRHDSAIRYMLKSATNRLKIIREQNVSAAGLVIAASVTHAEEIAQILSSEGQKVEIVSYYHPGSAGKIEKFRHDSTMWIVSVGMISEGTDIPRLQVCCYLSSIKTELYFRQVLGRVLRRTASHNQEAWLYAFAEPSLVDYANRVEVDVPDEHIVVQDSSFQASELLPEICENNFDIYDVSDADEILLDIQDINKSQIDKNKFYMCNPFEETSYDFGTFRESVIATFNSPFT